MALSIGVPGIRAVAVSANPGALAAVTAVDVDVAVSDVDATDFAILLRANAALEARLVIQGVSIPAADTVRLRFTNQSAAAAGGGALTHTVGIIKQP